jgi:hypothetical protein
MLRGSQIVSEEPEHDSDRNCCDRRVEQPVASIEADPVGEIIQRLDQEGADPTIADIRGDLPLVLRRRDEIIHEDRQEKIEDYRLVLVAADGGAAFIEKRPPDEDRAKQRNHAEQGSEEKIPPVDEGVLQYL